MIIDRIVSSLYEYSSKSYWLNVVLTRKTFDNVFSSLGKFWFLITILSLFIPNIKPYISHHPSIATTVITLFLVWATWPKLYVCSNMKDCDINIEIKVGNVFESKGVYVIGTNTTFDTDISSGIISKNSLQGQVFSKFYKSRKDELDTDLDLLLDEINFDDIHDGRVGKKKRYPLGTVIQLRRKNKVFYWVAIANLNKYGSIENATFDELQFSISQLWKKVEVVGNIDPVIMPLLGSTRCRIPKTRMEFAKAIIDSFIIACQEKKLCEKLVIVISPQDYREHGISLRDLEDYLNCRCKFPGLKPETK